MIDVYGGVRAVEFVDAKDPSTQRIGWRRRFSRKLTADSSIMRYHLFSHRRTLFTGIFRELANFKFHSTQVEYIEMTDLLGGVRAAEFVDDKNDESPRIGWRRRFSRRLASDSSVMKFPVFDVRRHRFTG
ncbi:hypothetical protein PENTCL1PPCAC_9545, partial [Pristionchus entomophagus]